MNPPDKTLEQLQAQVEDLSRRLAQAQEDLRRAREPGQAEREAPRETKEKLQAGASLSFDVTTCQRGEAEVRRFASFPQLNPNPVLEIDVSGAITFYNQAAADVLEKQGRGGDPAAFLPGDLGEIQAAARQKEGKTFYREVRIGDKVFGETLHFAEDFDTLRIYALDITARKQTEEALVRAKDDWEATFNAVPDLIAILDDKHHIVRTNRTMAEALGTTPEKLAGRPCHEVMHNASGPPSFCPHSQLLADGRQHTAEVHELGHDFLVTASPLTDSRGNLLGSVHVARDITQRKQAEEEKQAAAQRVQAVLESISDGFFVLDENLVVTYFNRAAEQLLGRRAEEVVGRHLFEEAFPEAKGSIFEEKYTWALRAKEAFTFEAYFEPHENWYDVRLFPFENGISVYFQVTTTRKQAEEALKQAHAELEQRVKERTRDLEFTVAQLQEEARERQRAEEALAQHAALVQDLYNHAPCGYHSLDAAGTFVQINDTELAWLGCTRDEVLGRLKFSDLLTADSLKVFQKNFPLFKERGWVRDLEYDLVRRDGTILPVSLSATAVTDARGKFRMSRSTVVDISHRRQAEEFTRDLFVSSLIGLYTIQDKKFRLINPGFREITGYDEEEIKDLDFQSLVHPEDREMCRDRAVQMLKGTNPRPYEYRVITKGGEVRWILETVVSTQYQGRRASLGNFMDITQRKQAVENLGRQTAVLEGINRIFRETLTCESEEELSRTCLKVAEELTGSKFGFINELNQEGSLRCLAFSDPGWQACRMPREKAQDLLHDLKPRGLFCKAVKDEQSFIANNPPSHPESGGLPEGHPPIASFMGVPLKHGGQTMGLIGLANKAGGFDPADQETLETLAVAIVEALMRFRAEKKAMSAGRLYRLLSEVNESIVRASDQLTLFQEVCRIVVESGGFRLAWIGTIDPDHQAVKALARYGFEEGYLEDLLIPLQDVPESRGPTGVAVREGRYDVCNDFATDPRMAPWREKALPRGYRSSAAFPLRVGSQVVGALTLYADRPGFFNREEIALLESMAADLSFAWESLDREVKRRRAEEALKESEERLRYLTSQLMTAQERERKRIAAELHDELGQALTVLKLHLRALERQLRPEQQSLKTDLVEILEYLGEVIENVRRLYRDLSPKVLEDLGLTAALQDLINDFADSYQLENLEVSLDDIDEAFPPAARTIIYRIFQEILNNIVKHSGCSRVAITLRKEAGQSVFKVEDNGKGFDAAGAPGERGVGLTTLEERVRMLGGNLDFWSRENQGTRVTFSIPIQ